MNCGIGGDFCDLEFRFWICWVNWGLGEGEKMVGRVFFVVVTSIRAFQQEEFFFLQSCLKVCNSCGNVDENGK